MPYEPIIPEGQHLGTSRNVDGAVTGHLFEDGTNDLKGHAAWRWVEDSDEDYSSNYVYEPPRQLTPEEKELAEKIAGLILVGIIIGVETAAPHVKRWWSEKLVPAVKDAWRRAISPRKRKSQTAEVVAPVGDTATIVASVPGVGLMAMESKIRMSSTEWRQRFQAMLVAGAFKEEQQRILAKARIEDDEDALVVSGETAELTPQRFVEQIKLILESNPALLDGETSAELVRVFGKRAKP